MVDFLRYLPEDIDIEILFDIDRAINLAILEATNILSMEVVMQYWFDIIVGQAIKASSIAESDGLIELYMDSIPVSMEETLIEICESANICMSMEDMYLVNSPQMSVMGKKELKSEEGGFLIWG